MTPVGRVAAAVGAVVGTTVGGTAVAVAGGVGTVGVGGAGGNVLGIQIDWTNPGYAWPQLAVEGGLFFPPQGGVAVTYAWKTPFTF